MDRRAIKEFWINREKDPENYLWAMDLLEMNIGLVTARLQQGDSVLDLGCGMCEIADRISPVCKTVVAVDRASFRSNNLNVTNVQSDILDFNMRMRFDLILLFGVANFFEPREMQDIYAMCHVWLRRGGKLLVKHQCSNGSETVHVDRNIPELGGRYIAQYRSAFDENTMLHLAFFNNVEISDPYPMEYNKHADTGYKLFEAVK